MKKLKDEKRPQQSQGFISELNLARRQQRNKTRMPAIERRWVRMAAAINKKK